MLRTVASSCVLLLLAASTACTTPSLTVTDSSTPGDATDTTLGDGTFSDIVVSDTPADGASHDAGDTGLMDVPLSDRADGRPTDGAPSDVSNLGDVPRDTPACGMCGAVANGTSGCANNMCTAVCNMGYADCDGLYANGCEVNLQTDPSHCGTCSDLCAMPANASPTCLAGVCSFVCTTGFGNCDGDNTNGCEANLSTDLSRCGSCSTMCPAPANATPTCTNGACGFTCNAGFADCNGMASDGCEAALGSDPANCGACGTACPAVANATPTCTNGVCGYTCNLHYADCNGMASDGCEIDLYTDASNCGHCGTACDPTCGYCATGACRIFTIPCGTTRCPCGSSCCGGACC